MASRQMIAATMGRKTRKDAMASTGTAGSACRYRPALLKPLREMMTSVDSMSRPNQAQYRIYSQLRRSCPLSFRTPEGKRKARKWRSFVRKPRAITAARTARNALQRGSGSSDGRYTLRAVKKQQSGMAIMGI